MSKKSKTKEAKAWLDDVASLGCVACRNHGYGETPAQVHHVREGQGIAQRASDFETIPLCPPHHLGTAHPIVPSIHKQKTRFEREFGTERELLEQTIREVELLRANRIGGAF